VWVTELARSAVNVPGSTSPENTNRPETETRKPSVQRPKGAVLLAGPGTRPGGDPSTFLEFQKRGNGSSSQLARRPNEFLACFRRLELWFSWRHSEKKGFTAEALRAQSEGIRNRKQKIDRGGAEYAEG